MVNIANSSVTKLINTTTNHKTGTTVKKLLISPYGKKTMATVVEYGPGSALKKRGIDAFVKITGAESRAAEIDKALFSGNKIILDGASKAENFKKVGSFNERFKEMISLLKKNPNLTAGLIPNTSNDIYYRAAINKFRG